jgi:hypothetical protein
MQVIITARKETFQPISSGGHLPEPTGVEAFSDGNIRYPDILAPLPHPVFSQLPSD